MASRRICFQSLFVLSDCRCSSVLSLMLLIVALVPLLMKAALASSLFRNLVSSESLSILTVPLSYEISLNHHF